MAKLTFLSSFVHDKFCMMAIPTEGVYGEYVRRVYLDKGGCVHSLRVVYGVYGGWMYRVCTECGYNRLPT